MKILSQDTAILRWETVSLPVPNGHYGQVQKFTVQITKYGVTDNLNFSIILLLRLYEANTEADIFIGEIAKKYTIESPKPITVDNLEPFAFAGIIDTRTRFNERIATTPYRAMAVQGELYEVPSSLHAELRDSMGRLLADIYDSN